MNTKMFSALMDDIKRGSGRDKGSYATRDLLCQLMAMGCQAQPHGGMNADRIYAMNRETNTELGMTRWPHWLQREWERGINRAGPSIRDYKGGEMRARARGLTRRSHLSAIEREWVVGARCASRMKDSYVGSGQ